jgi:hypothetical protein
MASRQTVCDHGYNEEVQIKACGPQAALLGLVLSLHKL